MMRRLVRLLPAILVIFLGSISASPLRAEGYIGFYLGALFADDADVSDVDIFSPDPNIGSTKDGALRDVEIGSAVTFGLRLTYWSERHPMIGFDLDGFFWNFEIDDQSARSRDGSEVRLSDDTDLVDEGDFGAFVMTVRFLMRARFGESEQVPTGRVQIYGGLGPAFYMPSAALLLGFVSIDLDSGEALGFDGVVGIQAVTSERTAFFLEYRRTSLPDFEFLDRDEGKLDFESSTLQAGFNIRM